MGGICYTLPMFKPAEIDLDSLPDDPQLLRQMVAAQLGERRHFEDIIARRDKSLQEKAAELKNQSLLVEKLKHQLALLKRRLFGASSEKLSQEIDQLELMIEDLEVDRETDTVNSAPPADGEKADREKKTPVRAVLPDHLPREDVVHSPGDCCADCGGLLHNIGEDVLEQLDYVPASYRVIRIRRPKMACRTCEAVHQVPAPDHAINRGKAAPGLLAHVLMSKYMDHLPLYRQGEIYAREGIVLPRSTMTDWVGQVTRLLTPLYKKLEQHVLAQTSLHGDDTPVPVLHPGKGRTRTGRLWSYVYDGRPRGEEIPPAALFHYSPDRKGDHPGDHLKDYKGLLHTDGYSGFNKLYNRKTDPIREVACWAHVRRKFFDIHQSQPSPVTTEVLDLIRTLYQIEREVRGDPPDKRRAARKEKAGPLLQRLKKYLDQKQRQLPRKSALAAAIAYALKRWTALIYYIEDGRAEIDNNAVERSIRPVALGKKNWMFCGSDKGGQRAAMMYSLLETAKMNGVNGEAWLTDVLARIAAYPVNRVEDFLPWNWNTNNA